MSVSSKSRPSTARPRASAKSTDARRARTEPSTGGDVDDDVLIFGKQSFIWIGIGVALMVVGMLLMAGGAMPSPDVWDADLIYSFRRITLAPIVILTGLGVITYAILKK